MFNRFLNESLAHEFTERRLLEGLLGSKPLIHLFTKFQKLDGMEIGGGGYSN